MGMDFSVKFKKPIKFRGELAEEFLLFSRDFTAFINEYKFKENSVLEKIEAAGNLNLEFLTEPNLYDYRVNDLQLEFADGRERERLLKVQKELDDEAFKAWFGIADFLEKLNFIIQKLTKNKAILENLDYDSKSWLDYFNPDLGGLLSDLKVLSELLNEAKNKGLSEFTYDIL